MNWLIYEEEENLKTPLIRIGENPYCIENQRNFCFEVIPLHRHDKYNFNNLITNEIKIERFLRKVSYINDFFIGLTSKHMIQNSQKRKIKKNVFRLLAGLEPTLIPDRGIALSSYTTKAR